MQPIPWYRLSAVGALVVLAASGGEAPRPHAPQTQVPQTPAPRASVRELATIEGDVGGFVRLPSGRVLIYSVDDSTFAYDVATKRRTLIGRDMEPSTVSAQGDRLAFGRSAEDHSGLRLWTIPIDPRTGVAAGQAQLVSQRPLDKKQRPRFSPDGRLLAFGASTRADGTWDLLLVSPTGGVERVAATYPRPTAFAWSADGTALDVEVFANQTALERVPVTGGAKRALFPITPITSGMVVGVTPDARVAIYTENPDRFLYRTASGLEGEIQVPLSALDDGWGYDFSLDSTRYLTMTQTWHQRVRVLNLATGQARDLLPGTVPTSSPAWSPDGRRLAVLSGNNSHHDVIVINAEGSGQRRYPISMRVAAWFELAWEMPWSPDGKYLAFRTTQPNPQSSSSDDQRELTLLDVTSGKARVLPGSTAAVNRFVWRSDGKAIRALKGSSRGKWSIVEIPLTGPERVLRDISAEFPKARTIVFMSDREVAIAVPVGNTIDRYVLPLDGGPARRLSDPGSPEPGLHMGAHIVAGNRLLIAQVDGRVNEAKFITILSTVGEPTRTLRPPFSNPATIALPDAKQIVSVGKAAGDSLYKLFLVPLDGSAPRLVGEIPGRGTGGLLAPSPDGKFLAYTSEGRYTSTIHEIDFGPALQAIIKP